MGLKFSKKRDAPVNSAEGAEEPAAARPEGAEDEPGTAQEGEAGDKQDLDVVVMKPATPVASLPNEDCVWERKEVEEGEEAESKDAPADPLVPEPTTEADPDPATGAQVVPPEPEPAMNPADSLPVDPEPAPEAQAHKDTVTVATVPDPVMTSPALGDLGDPAPGPDATPASVNPDDECRNKCEETSEAEQLRNDVDEGNVDRLLENLELTGSDLVADVIPADTETCDDTPDMST
ncbi:vegetative cell wall protein gp1-like [Takifugu rubripes]|uniref:vegetative cell wall protein gp1-like n=1 Tax=Takifugu rubripes TaxID=31033 RepID=UPI0005D21963|nr:vegetative cell wall protein gp1-like [Takifugu rubripes]|eukprot:XP_011605232.1 PREDICTED: proteoglycan 4-like [Takifugu rubripes]